MKPKIYTKKVIVSLSEEQKKELERASIEEMLSMAEFMRNAIMEKIERLTKRNGGQRDGK
ncbi:MAG: ribbon-helix-helix protein, CopG family [Candidatus Pacearchaeota archaeon]|jgi:hypothetical protein